MSQQANDNVTQLTQDIAENLACELHVNDEKSREIIKAFLYRYGANIAHLTWVETLQKVEEPPVDNTLKYWKIKAHNYSGRDNGHIRTFSVVGSTIPQAIYDLWNRFPVAGDAVCIKEVGSDKWINVSLRKPRNHVAWQQFKRRVLMSKTQ